MTQPATKYKFHVNGIVYESDSSSLTGAQIRERANVEANFSLFLEGHGSEQDQAIQDTTTVDLSKDHGPQKFFTVPPATFGHE